MKNSWSCGRAAVPRTLIFRTVRMQDLILKTLTKPSVWQSSESENKTSLCWQTFFNYQWTSVVHKERSVIELKVYACYWKGFLILAVIQIWSADLEDQFQSYAWLRTKSWTTFSTITATEYLNRMTISWILICYRSMLMSYMQKVPHQKIVLDS